MSMRQISERDGYELPAGAGHQRSDDCAHTSRIARLSQLMLLAIGTYFGPVLPLWPQQPGEPIRPWRPTPKHKAGKVNPQATSKSQPRTANARLTKKSLH